MREREAKDRNRNLGLIMKKSGGKGCVTVEHKSKLHGKGRMDMKGKGNALCLL